MSVKMRKLVSSAPNFKQQLRELQAWQGEEKDVGAVVDEIIRAIRERGDAALLDYTRRFDQRELSAASELRVDKSAIERAASRVSKDLLSALEEAASRIRDYHQHQLQGSWSYTEEDGTVLGQQLRAMDRVGLYVPGGKAAYPSSVLMAAIPAKVAGVSELVMVSPAPRGELNDVVLAAAQVAGVDTVFSIGGAQAVAALAYGTESIPRVDKIVGPGNIYVASAKRAVFGQVAIDMIAGPSEILVVCDGNTDPDWVAFDLFSQAEHDELAQAILVTPSEEFAAQVEQSIERLLPTLKRADIARASLSGRGAIILVKDLDEAMDVANELAPEHLELSVDNPERYLEKIRHAGAIFMGRHSSEALGDYCAGPNHVLPTSGTARFSSPLGVYDFVKRSSVIHCSAQAAQKLGRIASTLARAEGLEAHALSAEARFTK